MKNLIVKPIVILAIFLASFGCKSTPNANSSALRSSSEANVSVYGYDVVNTFPHDANAFTQGLVFSGGRLLESTGQQGRSSLREVEVETGKILKRVDLPAQFFGEGITVLKGKIYQLTWQHQRGFIYDLGSFEKLGEFTYEGEGWGLTNDGQSLILSDGTNRLRFLDPNSFRVIKTIAVSAKETPVTELNELEYIKGGIYANIWHQNQIARIDPQTGQVIGWIDLAGLLSRIEIHDDEAVLNGIAYDEATGRLFVTGKLWPKLFEIRIRP